MDAQVPCTVNCTMRPLGSPVIGDRALSITPAQLEIPALESRFVLLSFAPAAVRAYAASLELSVAGGGGATDFKCEVKSRAGMQSPQLRAMPCAVKVMHWAQSAPTALSSCALVGSGPQLWMRGMLAGV